MAKAAKNTARKTSARKPRASKKTFPIATQADNLTVAALYEAHIATELAAIEPVDPAVLTDEELSTIEVASSVEDMHNEVQVTPASFDVPRALAAENDNFRALIDAVSDEDEQLMLTAFTTSLDARVSFETEKSRVTGKDSIFKSINKSRQKMALPTVARVLEVQGVDWDFANRVTNEGARYNVYAIDKVQDIARALAYGKKVGNAINNAIVRSLIAFSGADLMMTMDDAKACASDKIRLADKVKAGLMTRHTVSASTAPTQASSSMQALVTLGLVVDTGTARAPLYALNKSAGAAELTAIMTS